MPTKIKSELDQSWVISDTEARDGDISWAEDTDQSDIDQKPRTKKLETPPSRQRPAARQAPSTRPSTSASQLEFIMPTLNEKSKSSRVATTRQTPTRISQRDVRHTSRVPVSEAKSSPREHLAPASDKLVDMVLSVGSYLLEIIASAMKTLKKPISWVVAAYAFAALCVFVQNLVTSSITNALSPICRIPGVSLLHLPICRPPFALPGKSAISSDHATPANPEFDALMTIQGKFETVLEDSASGVTLPLDMKRSETSIRDLRQVVRFSSIPSRNELLHEFDGFIETARIASYDLQRFNSHVGRAVDSVLSTARWTQRVLDDISLKSSQSSGLITDFISNRLLAPFQPLQFTEARLLDQYITHTRLISNEIEALIEEAQALLLVLTNLEDRLDIIHGISLRDNIAAKSSRDEILGQLWTYIGGNRAKLGKVDSQLRLLARVGEYRKLAYAHVSGTILKLQAMDTELEELRTRVGSAAVAEDRGLKGIPLSVHIENIRLGVERLEGQREKAREVERGHVRNVIGKVVDRDEEHGRQYLVDAS